VTAVAWFNVDDSFYDHPKVWDAPDCAVALWTRAGSWSSRNLTDGFVPAGMPARFCGDHEQAIRELLDRGLWIRTRGGYLFHDWTDWNSSKEAVKARRTASARRQALFRDPVLKQAVRERDQDGCRYCGTLVRWGSGRSPLSGTYDHLDPAGENTYDNLVVSCLSCNARKGGRTPFQAGMKVLDPPKPRNASHNAIRNASVEASTNAIRNASVEGFQSNPDLSLVDVVDHLSRRIAHAYEDDDLVRAIVDSIQARTGQVIPAAHASIIAAQILEGRRPDNPVAYVQKAITSEKDPKGRFLPPPGYEPPRPAPEWCGGQRCNPGTRRLEHPESGADLGPCPDCHPSIARPA
jgi:5-methylcytosine-specific restriction endonuclease McrA